MAIIDFKRDPRISVGDRDLLREHCKEFTDPVLLAKALGLKVHLEDLHDSEAGYLAYTGDGVVHSFAIVLNKNHPVQRQQFTVAHEIGHYVLHRNSAQFVREMRRHQRHANVIEFPIGRRSEANSFYDVDLTPEMEAEANYFAATILLPPLPLKRCEEFIGGKPAALAKRLHLSPSFVTRRFEEIYFGEV